MRTPTALCLTLAMALAPLAHGADATPSPSPDLPPDNAYCVVDADGHLSIDGKRLRLWGAIGSFPPKPQTIDGNPYGRHDRTVQRVKDMGFNAFRIWHMKFGAYEKGDQSSIDFSDYFFAKSKDEGLKFWVAGFGGGHLFEDQLDQAATVIDEPETAEAWKEAVRSKMKTMYYSKDRKVLELKDIAVAWDPRLEALAIESMRNKANHVNQYTGLRYADDPAIVVWELTNEQWWTRRMGGGQWKKLPKYFRASLIEKWHQFLETKYGSQEALVKAWGFVRPGEDLSQRTVLFAPMAGATKPVQLNDTNPAAIAAFENIEGKFGRDDFTKRRGEDVMEFLVDTIVSHKKRWAAAMKTWGKSTKLSPLLFDTGIGYNAQSQYLHQQADAVSHAAYMEGDQVKKLDPQLHTYPFYSGLDRRPLMANDVPWLEHNKIEGKPFLCYETQLGSPNKYRAEWPLRIAALGAIQDWDAACFHYWTAHNYDYTKENPFEGHLSFPGPGAYQYDYTFDEVEFAAMRAAAAVFLGGSVDPAPNPTTFTFGHDAVFDPDSMDYAGSYGRDGWNMADTTYRYGVRIKLDPEQKEFCKVEGPVVRWNGYERANPIRPNDEIEFDTSKAHLKLDSDAVASYTGFFGRYGSEQLSFNNGVVVTDLQHNDPEGTPFPSKPDERYFSFTLASTDGASLAETKSAVLSLVASSFNTGLTFDPEQRKFTSYGKGPQLVTRMSATVTAPQIAGMRYVLRDFAMKPLAEGSVGADGVLAIPSELAVFSVDLSR
jgi:hypothetical protein